MPAGGFKTFTSGEILTSADVNSFLMQGVLVFADATARDAAITSPVEGQFAFRKDDDAFEVYDGSAWVQAGGLPTLEALVIAGGGGGGKGLAGGGGAGGYISTVDGETSGGGISATPVFFEPGTYPLVIGAGGAGGVGTFASATAGLNGLASAFGSIISAGGGGGGSHNLNNKGIDGGSGGGRAQAVSIPGNGQFGQGFAGGDGETADGTGGGGGGAGEAGSTTAIGHGGDGVSSSITGSAVFRGGGGGGAYSDTDPPFPGGAGGGGDGDASDGTNATNGTANTGGGGGGAYVADAPGNGGSGVVILRVKSGTSLSFSAGVSQTSSTVGSNDVYTVTATSTTSETVTIG